MGSSAPADGAPMDPRRRRSWRGRASPSCSSTCPSAPSSAWTPRHGSEFAPTVGFFLTTHPSEEFRYSEAVQRFEFDGQLGPYNLDSFGDWKQLSSYLSQSVIECLEPIGGEITIALETSWMDRAPQTDMERRLMEQLREDKFAKKTPAQPERGGCYYTTIPASVKHRNISAEELTLLNLDRTSLLESVLAKDYQGQEDLLLGSYNSLS